MEQAGLLRGFQNGGMNGADPNYCLRKIQQEMNVKMGKQDKKPLTLKGLSGAFVILGVGYAFAILVFLSENCCSHFKTIIIIRKQRKQQR